MFSEETTAFSENAAVKGLRDLDVGVEFVRDDSFPNGMWSFVHIDKDWRGDPHFLSVTTKVPGIRSALIDESPNAVACLKALRSAKLHSICIASKKVDANLFRSIAQLKTVTIVWIEAREVDEGALHMLSSLQELKELKLFGTQLTQSCLHKVNKTCPGVTVSCIVNEPGVPKALCTPLVIYPLSPRRWPKEPGSLEK